MPNATPLRLARWGVALAAGMTIVAGIALTALPATAFQIQEEVEIPHGQPHVTDYLAADRPDVAIWKLLARAKEVPGERDTGEFGQGPRHFVADFSPEIEALDGKTVVISGFMLPLEYSEKQKHFLLGPRPPSCPYCLAVGPAQLIEVMLEEPLKVTFSPVQIEGKLELMRDHPSGLFYRIETVSAKKL